MLRGGGGGGVAAGAGGGGDGGTRPSREEKRRARNPNYIGIRLPQGHQRTRSGRRGAGPKGGILSRAT